MSADNNNKISEIDRMIAGYKKYRKEYFTPGEENPDYQNLVDFGQRPKVMIITCSDARVNPSQMLGCRMGELFIVRNVANLVPPYEADSQYHGTSAAIEFAVLHLEVEHIIVMGHSRCGGINSLYSSIPRRGARAGELSFIAKWMQIAEEAKDDVEMSHPEASLGEKVTLCEKRSLVISLENLMTFPWIRDKVEGGLLDLRAWYFDLKSGDLVEYKQPEGDFEPLK